MRLCEVCDPLCCRSNLSYSHSFVQVSDAANVEEPPARFEEYAFLSYDCKPLPTRHLTTADVLRFRDDAWHRYFSNPAYLSLIA